MAPVPAPSSTSSVPASPSRQQPQPAAAPVAPPSKSSQYVLDVTITLKALVPELNAAGVAILNRVVDRQLHLSHYGCYWEVRPQVPVAGNEHLWWQHAGRALAAGVRSSARREVPLSRLAARRAARLEYQALYAGKHAASSLFREPGRRWYHLRRVRALDAETQDRLEALEEGLSLEELAHFRLGVAATYNKQLAENSRLLHFMADKIDALVSTRREPLRTSLADLLLHRDRQDPYAADIEGGGARCSACMCPYLVPRLA